MNYSRGGSNNRENHNRFYCNDRDSIDGRWNNQNRISDRWNNENQIDEEWDNRNQNNDRWNNRNQNNGRWNNENQLDEEWSNKNQIDEVYNNRNQNNGRWNKQNQMDERWNSRNENNGGLNNQNQMDESWNNRNQNNDSWNNENQMNEGWNSLNQNSYRRNNENQMDEGWNNRNQNSYRWNNENQVDEAWNNRNQNSDRWNNENQVDEGWNNRNQINDRWNNENQVDEEWNNRNQINNSWNNENQIDEEWNTENRSSFNPNTNNSNNLFDATVSRTVYFDENDCDRKFSNFFLLRRPFSNTWSVRTSPDRSFNLDNSACSSFTRERTSWGGEYNSCDTFTSPSTFNRDELKLSFSQSPEINDLEGSGIRNSENRNIRGQFRPTTLSDLYVRNRNSSESSFIHTLSSSKRDKISSDDNEINRKKMKIEKEESTNSDKSNSHTFEGKIKEKITYEEKFEKKTNDESPEGKPNSNVSKDTRSTHMNRKYNEGERKNILDNSNVKEVIVDNKLKELLNTECVKCPSCSTCCDTFEEYNDHLISKKHKDSLSDTFQRIRVEIQSLRVRQSQVQNMLNKRAAQENPRLRLRTLLCSICKLNYCTMQSKHQSTFYHLKLKQRILPYCKICRIQFKTPMSYERHLCTISHIKKKSDDMPKLTKKGSEPTGPVINPKFIVIDAVGSGKFEVEKEQQSNKQQQQSNTNEKADDDENDKEIIIKSEETTEDEIDSFIRQVDAYFCDLCQTFLPKISKDFSRIQFLHCKTQFHLQRYQKFCEKQRKLKENQPTSESNEINKTRSKLSTSKLENTPEKKQLKEMKITSLMCEENKDVMELSKINVELKQESEVSKEESKELADEILEKVKAEDTKIDEAVNEKHVVKNEKQELEKEKGEFEKEKEDQILNDIVQENVSENTPDRKNEIKFEKVEENKIRSNYLHCSKTEKIVEEQKKSCNKKKSSDAKIKKVEMTLSQVISTTKIPSEEVKVEKVDEKNVQSDHLQCSETEEIGKKKVFDQKKSLKRKIDSKIKTIGLKSTFPQVKCAENKSFEEIKLEDGKMSWVEMDQDLTNLITECEADFANISDEEEDRNPFKVMGKANGDIFSVPNRIMK